MSYLLLGILFDSHGAITRTGGDMPEHESTIVSRHRRMLLTRIREWLRAEVALIVALRRGGLMARLLRARAK